MMVQIPLTWQLTDLLCAMGLGFLYGALYAALQRLLRRRKGALVRNGPRVFGTQPGPLRRSVVRRLRKCGSFAAEALWAVCCLVFTRAWVLSGSHAAQFRWSMAVGIALGFVLFRNAVQPRLRALAQRLWRLVQPLTRVLGRIRQKAHTAALERREQHRKRWQKHRAKREKQMEKRMEKRGQTVRKAASEKTSKKIEKNMQKELQKPLRIYYNNL